MIAQKSIQEVLNRADIVDVVGQFVRLKKRGVNHIGNCPFHNEKTPSFNVNSARGIFKCFGCGKGGDVVSFIKEYEKLSFTEAIRWLANYYQIELEETETSEEHKEAYRVEESLRVINEYATAYFQDILHNHEQGKIIGGGYFVERGFNKKTIDKFKLGYCLDDWDAFAKTAIAQGYNTELLQKAGLIKIRDNGQIYDNYKGRAIFPIFSVTGRILGFGARILRKDDKAPKYVNSPENELYVKNKVLYGLYQSRQSIVKEDKCLLVEGYTDVISLHQAGIENVVSSSGTSLTEGQLKLIGNLTKKLTILYDGDAAGIKAALRGLDLALAESFNVRLVLLPEVEDPDSFVQKIGDVAFKKYIEDNEKDFVSFKLELGLKEAGNDQIKKAELVNEIAATIAHINKAEDFTLRQYYIREVAEKLKIEEEGLINLVNKFLRNNLLQTQRKELKEIGLDTPQTPTEADAEKTEINTATTELLNIEKSKVEWKLLKLIIEYGNEPYNDEGKSVIQEIYENVDPEIFEDSLAKSMLEMCLESFETNHKSPEVRYFVNHPDELIRTKTADLLQEAYQPSHNWKVKIKIEVPYGDELYKEELNSTLKYFELKLIRKNIAKNFEQMEASTNDDNKMQLLKIHLKLKERERELMGFVIVR